MTQWIKKLGLGNFCNLCQVDIGARAILGGVDWWPIMVILTRVNVGGVNNLLNYLFPEIYSGGQAHRKNQVLEAASRALASF